MIVVNKCIEFNYHLSTLSIHLLTYYSHTDSSLHVDQRSSLPCTSPQEGEGRERREKIIIINLHTISLPTYLPTYLLPLEVGVMVIPKHNLGFDACY